MDVCCPLKIDIKFEADDKIKKIKAGFDRSCVITGKNLFFFQKKNNINKKKRGIVIYGEGSLCKLSEVRIMKVL